jgi:tRNA threonylcarbamoyladenosine biosynthesis protein TsaE
MITEVASTEAMMEFGARIGALCSGGEVIVLVGDIGAGKTTFTKGLARTLGIDEEVQSPTFTISRVYDARDGLRLAHYDFYRLSDPGVMAMELTETAHDPRVVTVVEWADEVANVLPTDRLVIKISAVAETIRHIELTGTGSKARALMERLQ